MQFKGNPTHSAGLPFFLIQRGMTAAGLPTVIISIASFENDLYSHNKVQFRTQRMHLHF
jgi:hypothetical protein